MTSMRKHINLFASAHTAVAKSLNTIIMYMNVMVIGLALKEEELGPQVSNPHFVKSLKCVNVN